MFVRNSQRAGRHSGLPLLQQGRRRVEICRPPRRQPGRRRSDHKEYHRHSDQRKWVCGLDADEQRTHLPRHRERAEQSQDEANRC